MAAAPELDGARLMSVAAGALGWPVEAVRPIAERTRYVCALSRGVELD